MRVVPKLALALLAGVFTVVAGFTAWQVRRDIELFDQDARRDQRIIGVTAGAALATTRTRDEGLRLARRVDATRETIHVRYVSFGSDDQSDLRPTLPLASTELSHPGAWSQRVKTKGPGEDADLLVTYVAAPVVDDPRGAIEITQPLASRAQYAWRGVLSALATSLAMLLVGSAVTAVIGARVVGQPVAELIAAARRIGEGNFDVLTSVERQDEFGELAREMRAMGLELSDERKRSRSEMDARIAALEQLRHADRLTTLGKLASVLAHEIGTPLNVIAGHAKLLARTEQHSPALQESIVTIGAQCDRITSIVRRVLDYARRRPPNRTVVNATDVFGQTRALLTSLAEQSSVQLSPVASPGPVELEADPGQLQQALTNVVVNAIQASRGRGNVELGLATTQRVEAGGPVELVTFTVRDEGEGMDQATQARIFEPFFTTKPAGEGTGLGLSVARDIVEEHGGTIEVTSVPGKGSAFVISLPRRADARSNTRS